MPLDHYVSQVHLRNFYSPLLDEQLYALHKSDMKAFQPRAQDVCRIKNGSTNPFMREARAIEEFLKTVEPNYNRALARLRSEEPDTESVYAIAGFAAYVATCSPAAARLN